MKILERGDQKIFANCSVCNLLPLLTILLLLPINNRFAHVLCRSTKGSAHAQTVHAKTTQSAHVKTPAQVAHKYLLYASSASALGTVKECPHTLSCQLTSSIKHCHRAQSNQPQNFVQGTSPNPEI